MTIGNRPSPLLPSLTKDCATVSAGAGAGAGEGCATAGACKIDPPRKLPVTRHHRIILPFFSFFTEDRVLCSGFCFLAKLINRAPPLVPV